MPTISRFYGIVIMMYHNDMHAPHFHAKYGEYSALIAIDDGAIIPAGCPSVPIIWCLNGWHCIDAIC